ncbi:MAG: peptidase domain-containing ABC transporter [Polyangiaceae bacterium]|nr:peptidase domain-containing ABC transporter [Polyangiaceae bacterium]
MRTKVPLLLQMSTTECGAACLAMVLSALGRSTTVSECHELCGAGRDGATAKSIVTAARNLGLKARAFRAEPEALLSLPAPMILHVSFNHFVVIERVTRTRVWVVDPTGGRYTALLSDFEKDMTGVVLTFEKTPAFVPRKEARSTSLGKRAVAAMKGDGVWKWLGQVLLVSTLQHGAGLVIPGFSMVLFDKIIPRGDLFSLHIAVLGLGLVLAGQAVLNGMRAVTVSYVQSRLDVNLMTGFFRHLMSLPLRYFEERSSGDLLMRIAGNTAVRDILGQHISTAVLDALLVVFYFGLLTALSPALGGVALVAASLQVALLWVAHWTNTSLVYHELAAQASSQGYLIEALKGIRTLKASGTEARAVDHWEGWFLRSVGITQRRNVRTAWVDSALFFVRLAAPLALLWIGSIQVMQGRLSVGSVWALLAIGTSALLPLGSLVTSAQRLSLAKGELARIAEALSSEPEQHGRTVRAAPMLKGGVDVSHLTFRYGPQSPDVLFDVSLTVAPGSKVALVGRTGSGKSTLLSLLLGLYEPTHGQVCYDGQPLGSLRYSSVRRQIGVVTQEVFLFAGSIRDNITFGSPDVTQVDVERAARAAALHDDILQMPMGYETLVGEGGIALSGGQRQRLAFARAIVGNPKIVILDEATSQLDAATEAQITHALKQLAVTRIVVAHRLSTVVDSDLIVVLDGGRVVETGRHAELIEKGGVYTQLAAHQGFLPEQKTLFAVHRFLNKPVTISGEQHDAE